MNTLYMYTQLSVFNIAVTVLNNQNQIKLSALISVLMHLFPAVHKFRALIHICLLVPGFFADCKNIF